MPNEADPDNPTTTSVALVMAFPQFRSHRIGNRVDIPKPGAGEPWHTK